MFEYTSYADLFRVMLLQPGIREFKESDGNRNPLDVILHNLFRQMKMWKCDYSSLPQRGLVGYDPGIPESEAKQVYEILDSVFKEVFPTQANLSREDAATYVETVISNVYIEILGEGTVVPGCKQYLIIFMEKLLEALERLAKKPVAEVAV